MKDPRIEKLAKQLIEYSVKLKKGQTVVITGGVEASPLIIELIGQIYDKGAFPFIRLYDEQISRTIMMGMNEALSKKMLETTAPLYEKADVHISIVTSNNAFEMSDVPIEKQISHGKHFSKPLMDIRRKKQSKWVLLNWPSSGLAQKAQMSLETFTDYYFEVCNFDYSKMHKAMIPLKELMEKTNKVRIVGKDTDLTFSIKGQKACICSGEYNIPDGEVFTSPIRDSVNGFIKFNVPLLTKSNTLYNDVRLTFEKGKVIKAESSNTKALNAELDSDEGARYVGEFAIGVNPYMTRSILDTLFDEKMSNSIHIALGICLEEAPNGNESQIHEDIVLTGSEIWFDDVCIRKDGKFQLKELKGLNPENLK